MNEYSKLEIVLSEEALKKIVDFVHENGDDRKAYLEIYDNGKISVHS